MNSRQWLSLIAAVAVLTQLAAVPVAAQSDENPVDGFISEESDCFEFVEFLCGLRDGSVARTYDGATAITDDRTASDITDELKQTFNSNSGQFESYANARLSPDSNSAEVFEVTVEKDGSSTIYLTSDVVNGEYTNASIVDSTDRNADESCTLEGNAARNAPSELEEFHTDFVAENKSVTATKDEEMATRYAGNVNCTFLGGA